MVVVRPQLPECHSYVSCSLNAEKQRKSMHCNYTKQAAELGMNMSDHFTKTRHFV